MKNYDLNSIMLHILFNSKSLSLMGEEESAPLSITKALTKELSVLVFHIFYCLTSSVVMETCLPSSAMSSKVKKIKGG